MSIVVGGDINDVNEIIVSVNYQDTVASSLTEIASIMNSIVDKKVEKNEKREKVIKSNSKLNTRLNSNSEKESSKFEERNNVKKEKAVKKCEELSIHNYNTLLVVKYKMDELKKLCTKYKISKGGNKDDLTKRIYEYCKNSVGPLKIQKVFRGFLCRKLHRFKVQRWRTVRYARMIRIFLLWMICRRYLRHSFIVIAMRMTLCMGLILFLCII